MHLFASQVDPACFDMTNGLFDKVMHLAMEGIEDLFPPERRAKGDYALIGGGFGVGNSAICAAYVMGYREIHCFGFDSSHREGNGHAYSQPMNDDIPTVETEWGGKTYLSTVPMKAHAARFQLIAAELQRLGCTIHVHGDGLLPAMWRDCGKELSERDKYRRMWATDAYRESSPGERIVDKFIEIAKPEGLIVDFGCGTGRAALALNERGHDVCLVDFADNCRDKEARGLPFVVADLTEPMRLRGDIGYCTDVMEHIPTRQVHDVVRNIMAAVPKCFFQISTVPDAMGALIGKPLHLTVASVEWWRSLFKTLGYTVEWEDSDGISCQFLVVSQKSSGVYG